MMFSFEFDLFRLYSEQKGGFGADPGEEKWRQREEVWEREIETE